MDFNEFTKVVRDAVEEFMGAEYDIKLHEVAKNNGRKLHGLVIMKRGSNCSPNIYLEDFYEDFIKGTQIGDIVRKISELYYSQSKADSIDVSFFDDYEQVKNRLGMKVINYDRNIDMLREMPFIPFEDLAIVFYCVAFNDNLGNGIIMIRKEHMEKWGVNTVELYQDAITSSCKHFPANIKSLAGMVLSLMGEEAEGEKNESINDILVITNDEKVNGASCIFYPELLANIGRRLSKNYYILPSSIHETLVVPEQGDYQEVKILQEMVRQVNKESVNENDFLSDNIYYFDRRTNILKMCECSDNTMVKCV
ncbi:MAG: DUF5688 family protein [Butyrivibrio sp.]|nr:DUF5688 family protein [Butyrivibrio sp.]